MSNAIAGRLRWAAKKTVRKSVVVGASAMRVTRRCNPVPGCRGLTYHRFAATPRDPFAVTPRTFAEQMAYLAECGLAISLQQLEDHLSGRRPLPRDAVMVTIDDGVRSVYEHALPVLRDYRIPAVLYLTPSLIGVGRDHNDAAFRGPEPYLNWDEVARLAAAGASIGSHGWTHRSLGGRPAAEVEQEGRRSREELERRLGRPVDSFACPYGTRADYDDGISAILARCGYRTAFTSQHGRVTLDLDPLQLPRVKVEGGEGLWVFKRLLCGALDGWRYIDQTLWRVQNRNG